MSGVESRVAGAPISWGVCEVPGWGHQMDRDRVLAEMAEIGLAATEFGPDGFLPDEPAAKARTLREHGLDAVGGFVPLVLHDPARDPLPALEATLDGFVGAGGWTLVLAAQTGREGYDQRPELNGDDWAHLVGQLDRVADRAADRGVRAVLHPHMGTLVETREDVDRVLHGSSVPLCVDTGHLLVGGTDPVQLVRDVPDRVAHTHLKDVDAGLAAAVRSGATPYTDAVRDGLFRPLGDGDVDVAGLVSALDTAGYDGWYVLEQDVILDGEPAPGAGPRGAVERSLTYIQGVLSGD